MGKVPGAVCIGMQGRRGAAWHGVARRGRLTTTPKVSVVGILREGFMKFQWKDGSRIRIPAQAAGERIESLRETLGRGVTPADVLADARSASSPLHSAFEWNDDQAAEQHRLMQAGHLLRCLVYVRIRVHHPKEKKARTYRRIRAFRVVTHKGRRGYERTTKVLSDAELRAQMLQQAFDELTAIKSKYRQLVELAGIFEAIAGLRKTLRLVKRRAKSAAAHAMAA